MQQRAETAALAACHSTLAKRGLVPKDARATFLAGTAELMDHLRKTIAATYVREENAVRVQDWRDRIMVDLRKKSLSSDTRRVYGDVLDRAETEMRDLLDATCSRAVETLSPVVDHVAFNMRRQCEYLNAAVSLDIERHADAQSAILESKDKEMQALQSEVTRVHGRLRALEATPDVGDATLCNELRQRCKDLEATQCSLHGQAQATETALRAAQRTILRLESELHTLSATFELTKTMYKKETTQLMAAIRQAPTTTTTTTTTSPTKYDPNSMRTLCFAAPESPTRPKSSSSPRRAMATSVRFGTDPPPRGVVTRPHVLFATQETTHRS
ncbi:hypothetical protein SPRG_04022 [Saprolegnia parasitica CBS 223.65]|uniref:Uncharacterized protein n=1 Tax=Saprolegnia parasitica (strain CBS 223.65) TaxID=695850 RepID=A0A067CY01_SAPPC|nr:hypothetical protein SPRG_04022 [Saprolegnia parasitica CBS 223.65]KDO31406.1 hypothetical protein SPRG_04022 [Saprolegnia parasitica CBS 223.65]|eukprot:XP_012198002.1 hypothetical protein SPRG_04022 [Saprolegnia parasitica CBS 223.65]